MSLNNGNKSRPSASYASLNLARWALLFTATTLLGGQGCGPQFSQNNLPGTPAPDPIGDLIKFIHETYTSLAKVDLTTYTLEQLQAIATSGELPVSTPDPDVANATTPDNLALATNDGDETQASDMNGVINQFETIIADNAHAKTYTANEIKNIEGNTQYASNESVLTDPTQSQRQSMYNGSIDNLRPVVGNTVLPISDDSSNVQSSNLVFVSDNILDKNEDLTLTTNSSNNQTNINNMVSGVNGTDGTLNPPTPPNVPQFSITFTSNENDFTTHQFQLYNTPPNTTISITNFQFTSPSAIFTWTADAGITYLDANNNILTPLYNPMNPNQIQFVENMPVAAIQINPSAYEFLATDGVPGDGLGRNLNLQYSYDVVQTNSSGLSTITQQTATFNINAINSTPDPLQGLEMRAQGGNVTNVAEGSIFFLNSGDMIFTFSNISDPDAYYTNPLNPTDGKTSFQTMKMVVEIYDHTTQVLVDTRESPLTFSGAGFIYARLLLGEVTAPGSPFTNGGQYDWSAKAVDISGAESALVPFGTNAALADFTLTWP